MPAAPRSKERSRAPQPTQCAGVTHGCAVRARAGVMELFTFIHMGGERERITVVEFSAEAHAALTRFDASKAQCFLHKDREGLLAVVEAGYGDLEPFNQAVRVILEERLQKHPEPRAEPEVALAAGGKAWLQRRLSHETSAPPVVVVEDAIELSAVPYVSVDE